MDGVLVIDKPEGPTSHDVVATARRALGEKRIGHTGTLDPLATGVLPLVLGRATRLVRFLTASDKDYDATILFGVTTDTLDVTGEETSRPGGAPSREALAAALRAFDGEQMQVPPAYSAKKVGGRRAYDFARRDEPVELAAVPVRVSRLELLESGNNRCRLSLTCSAGFYVRALVRDLGERCGTGATLEALRRTRSGEFTIDEAIPLDALEPPDPGSPTPDPGLIPMERLLTSFPAVTVTAEGLNRVSHGQHVRPLDVSGAMPSASSEWVRVLDAGGTLVALGTPQRPSGFLHPEVVLI
ncbi:MAG TPA: tRNA pseudouridine(55) synthase TruB [Vicinamibacterales bacterium]|nr:tRNA pseudouridine(55) synthase TruB [Vicinamibacterales bacterium]